jgi:hypothetical protein
MENDPESGFRMSVIEVENGENKEPSVMSPNNDIIINISNEKEPEIINEDSKRYNMNIMEIEKAEEEPNIVRRLSSAEVESVIFIFVNSDTNHGKDLLNLGLSKIEFKEKPNCIVHIYDKNDPFIQNGMILLKNELNRGRLLFI